MPRFLTDEDFDNDILRALRRHLPDLDIVRVQDVGLRTQPDESVLQWAADAGRVVLTHDANTMTQVAYARTTARLPMPGIVVVSRTPSIGQVVDDIELAVEGSLDTEWQGQVRYLPL
jgi:hypothetical protein